MLVTLLYNQPACTPGHPDHASEAGVLEAVEAVEAALAGETFHISRLAAAPPARDLVQKLANLPGEGIVFNLCEGFGGSAGEAHVAGVLDLLGLKYTGSPPECLALVRDKARTKRLLAGAGLPTPPFCLSPAGLPFPLAETHELLACGEVIVKPAAEDASLGLSAESITRDAGAAARQAAAIHRRYGDALIEQYIAGREFNVAVTALPEPQALPLAEICFDAQLAWPVVTYDAKWSEGSGDWHGTPVRCPAEVDEALANELRRLALACFQLAGCRQYARIDVRVDSRGRPFVLEINANPDLSPSAGLARSVAASGVGYEEFICRLVRAAAGAP